MNDIEVGQVLSLKIRFNNSGDLSQKKHPYLVISVDEEFNTVEIAQLDSLKPNPYKSLMKSNKVVFADNPKETVIDKDSYIQLDNIFRVEKCDELLNFRRQTDKLSYDKLTSVVNAYNNYHEKYVIDENKNVYMSKEEILELNKY